MRHLALEILVIPEDLLEQSQRRSAGADAELRIQREHHQLRDAICLDLLHGVLGEGFPVAHAHVHLRLLALSEEGVAKRARLLVGDAAKGRASADGLVRLAGFWCAGVTEKRGEGRLEELQRAGKADDVWVGEEIVEERLDVVELFRSAEVEEEDPHALGGVGVSRHVRLAVRRGGVKDSACGDGGEILRAAPLCHGLGGSGGKERGPFFALVRPGGVVARGVRVGSGARGRRAGTPRGSGRASSVVETTRGHARPD